MNNNIKVEGPLNDIRVVSLEHAIAAPFCTRQLADLGAEVIKVERPDVGDFARGYDQRVKGSSSHFVWTNRSKKSLSLNLKDSAAITVLEELLKETDVLVQNLAPGAAKRLGLSYEALEERFPHLIVCNISGYGEDGPYQNRKAYDLLIQSEAGFLSTTGFPGDQGMAKAGCSIADIAAGMYAYTAVLAAILSRSKTGKGSKIDISMLESLVEWMGYPMYYAFEGAEPPQRAGASHATIYPYGPFPAGDGKSVMLGLQNEREWISFCENILLMPDLALDSRFVSNFKRSENRSALQDIIWEVFSKFNAEEILKKLDNAGIANAHVNEMCDVWSHPQLQARNRWVDIESLGGTIPALLPPSNNSSYSPTMGKVPALGEHSVTILEGLGYRSREIENLKDKKVI